MIVKKITIITPVKNIEAASFAIQSLVNIKNIQLEFIGLHHDIEGVATYFDRTMIAPEIIALAYHAEKNGADAVIINCLSEPGLQAAKELLTIPVMGIFEATLSAIAKDKKHFSILLPQFHPDYLHMLQDTIRIHELQSLLTSLCCIDLAQDLNDFLETHE